MNVTTRALTRPIVGIIGLAYFALLVVLLVLNHMSPLAVLAMTLGAATLVVIALRPYLGLHAFIMLLFVENAFASRQGVTAMKLVGVLIVCGWLLSMGVRRQSPVRFDSLTIAILLFLVWSAITLLYAIDAEVAVSRTFTYIQLAGASLMFASVVDDPVKLRGVLRALVTWSLAATCIAIAGYYLGLTRVAVGLTGNRNLLATYIIVGVVCAYLLHQATTHRGYRVLLLLSLPVLFLGLAMTFSRTGLIVLGLALLVVWYRVAREKNFGVLLGSVAVLGVIMLLLPHDFYRRAESIVPVIQRQEDTFGTRIRLWKSGIRMIEDSPVLGVGPGNFVVAVHRYNRGEMLLTGLSAHNTYISVAAEMGLIGVGLFGLMLWLALQRARRAIRVARDRGYRSWSDLAVAGEISLLVLMGSGMSATVENLKMLWLLIGICAAMGQMYPLRPTPNASDADMLAKAALVRS